METPYRSQAFVFTWVYKANGCNCLFTPVKLRLFTLNKIERVINQQELPWV